jgi:hypothetical protein
MCTNCPGRCPGSLVPLAGLGVLLLS